MGFSSKTLIAVINSLSLKLVEVHIRHSILEQNLQERPQLNQVEIIHK